MMRTLAFAALAFLALTSPGLTQEISLNLGGDGTLTARSVQLLALITLLSLVPGLAIMITCFPFIVTVLSILRQGIGISLWNPFFLRLGTPPSIL